MMRKNMKRVAAVAAGLVGVALLPGAVLSPAYANHGGATLELTREINSVAITVVPTLTARLSAAPTAGTVRISFEVEGGPSTQSDNTPEVPDAFCDIVVSATTCTTPSSGVGAFVPSATGGTAEVRAWIDEDSSFDNLVIEADSAEGRYSSFQTDCNDGAANDPDFTSACPNPVTTPPKPGNDTERDDTDVVILNFNDPVNAVINCGDPNAPDGNVGAEAVPGGGSKDKVITCTVTRGGSPVNLAHIDAENISNQDGATNGFGANDPDKNGTGGAAAACPSDGAGNSCPDYDTPNQAGSRGTNAPNGSTISNGFFCETNAQGTCTGTIPGSGRPNGNETGPAIICFWLDNNGTGNNGDNVYNVAGALADGGGCGAERVADVENDDETDTIKLTWEAARVTSVDVTPEDATAPPGSTVKLSGSVLDQFGNKMKNQRLDVEYFAGSIGDDASDGNTPTSVDDTCGTGDTGTCTLEVSEPVAGIDRLCFFIGPAPVMTGNAQSGFCGSEGSSDVNGAPAIDVIVINWVTGAPPRNPDEEGGSTTGYWLTGSDGGIFAFGGAQFKGSTGSLRLEKPIVGMARHPSNGGYWLVASDGGIFAFGAAGFKGSMGSKPLNRPIVGMAATPTGDGYWLVASDGGIFSFGDAVFKGSTGALSLNQPVVGMASTPSGLGYWLVARDGGIFAFGDARFLGSMGATRLNRPVVGMASSPRGQGYWMVATDGGIFAFGNAPFHGSTGGLRLNQPIVGMSTITSGNGYRLVASDGGVFNFNAANRGSLGSTRLNRPIVGMDGF